MSDSAELDQSETVALIVRLVLIGCVVPPGKGMPDMRFLRRETIDGQEWSSYTWEDRGESFISTIMAIYLGTIARRGSDNNLDTEAPPDSSVNHVAMQPLPWARKHLGGWLSSSGDSSLQPLSQALNATGSRSRGKAKWMWGKDGGGLRVGPCHVEKIQEAVQQCLYWIQAGWCSGLFPSHVSL